MIFLKNDVQFCSLFFSTFLGTVAQGGAVSPIHCQAVSQNLEAVRSREAALGILPEEQTRIFAPEGSVKAVALVMHGLNQKPMRMDEFSRALAVHGILAVRGVLTGHGGEPERLKTVTREQWMTDTHTTYCLALASATQYKVPVVGVGFSLGALLISDIASRAEYADVKFEKAFFLAPALTPSRFARLTRFLAPFHFLAIPSANRSDNRSNFFTPILAYNAVFESVNSLAQRGFASLPFSVLAFIDPEDELVSAPDLQKLAQNMPPTFPWRVEHVTRGDDAPLKDHHHVIFESRFLGAKAWDRMVSAAVDFLLKKS